MDKVAEGRRGGGQGQPGRGNEKKRELPVGDLPEPGAGPRKALPPPTAAPRETQTREAPLKRDGG